MNKPKWTQTLKFKSALFLAALLLGALLLLSVLILSAVKQNQKNQLETELANIVRSANVTLQDYKAFQAQKMIQSASSARAVSVSIYSADGKLLESNQIDPTDPNRLKENTKGVTEALSGKIAYQVTGNHVYYAAPLYQEDKIVGVMLIHYDYSQYVQFYENLRGMMLMMGIGVFTVSFVLAVAYFGRLSKGISLLGHSIEQVETGQYETVMALNRNDELGTLSKGIKKMSDTIHGGILALKQEQENQRMFFGRITHEFKTPLSVINAYNDLADMYKDDLELNQNAHIQIKREVEHLNVMVEKALELSKLEKKDFELSWETVSLDTLIESCVSRLRVKGDKYAVTWHLNLSPIQIMGDQEILEQIMMNLLDNAIKYNKNGGDIWVVCNEEGIQVENTGQGLSPEIQSRLFEAFVVDDQNNLTPVKGTGLGLGLVKHLVHMHHGDIKLSDASIEHQSPQMKGCKVQLMFKMGLLK